MLLLSKIRLAPKFLLLGALACLMLALPTGLYFQGVWDNAAKVRKETQASDTVMAMTRTIHAMQLHRGLSAATLSGNSTLARQRPAVMEQVDENMDLLEAGLEHIGASPSLRNLWQDIHRRWRDVKGAIDSRSFDGSQSYQEHTRLIRQALAANDQLLAESGFSLDSEADTYFLTQAALVTSPQLGEILGMMRANGVAYLTQGSIDSAGKASLDSQARLARQLQERVRAELLEATEHNAVMRQALSDRAQDTRERIDAALSLAENSLMGASSTRSLDASQFFEQFTQAIDGLNAFDTEAMKQLTHALEARVSQSNQRLLRIGAILAFGIAVAIFLALAVIRSIIGPVRQAMRVASAVAQGDLTISVPVQGNDEFSQLMAEMARMRQNLVHLVEQMNHSSGSVAATSSDIAQSSRDLSSRTVSQASALEETAAAMEQMTAAVKQNADNAGQANTLSLSAVDVALKSSEVMNQVIQTMGAINESAQQVVEIIGVIDSIAFQTNILALNASIEAARAGGQGRGFAVVATEVRALAQRSAGAAKEIKALIEKSVATTEAGNRLVSQAGSTMQETVARIRRVTDLMAEISQASQEQSVGIVQISQAVTNMDVVTQQNAELVENAALSANGLQGQASEMARLVASFKIGMQGRGEPAVPSPVDRPRTAKRLGYS